MAAMVLAAAALMSAATLLAVRWVAGPHAQAAGSTGDGLGFARLHRPARPVSLPDLRGHGTFDLASVAGKPIVMNFWSSTCTPCQRETPALAGVARTLLGRVSFVGIDTVDARKQALAFVTRYRVPYQIAFDQNGTTADRYGIAGLPVTVFLSPSGKTVVGENVGELTAPKLRSILRRLYGIR